MASRLMKSVSGIRGVVGDTLTPELVVQVGGAFARFCRRGTVVLGRDSRPTGEAVSGMLRSVLMLSGCDVIDLGIVPTPTVQIMVEKLKSDGGVIVSASHNPVEWNAFKLVSKKGTFLNAADMKRFFMMMEEETSYPPWNRTGVLVSNSDAAAIHCEKVRAVINPRRIRKKRYRVVLDSVNGAGSVITIDLLKSLGCEVIPLYCTMNGRFPRGAEPLPGNLKALSARVKSSRADIGFAQDPDADRLAIVDEKGIPIGEEYTVTLVTEHILSKKRGEVVVNLSTTRAVEDVAAAHGCTLARSKVGEIHVVEEMRRRGALIGGEGNGGVISPEVHLGRDSLAGIGYVLDMMAERNKSVSELVSFLPRYCMKKGKITLGSAGAGDLLKKVAETFSKERRSDIDGLRIDFDHQNDFAGGWVHLRPSNTEPVFRIIAEGKTRTQAEKIYSFFDKLFRRH